MAELPWLMRWFLELRFYHDIWRPHRWIFVIFISIWSLDPWLQLCYLLHCEIPFRSGVMNFLRSDCAEFRSPLPLAAAAWIRVLEKPRFSRIAICPPRFWDFCNQVPRTVLNAIRCRMVPPLDGSRQVHFSPSSRGSLYNHAPELLFASNWSRNYIFPFLLQFCMFLHDFHHSY